MSMKVTVGLALNSRSRSSGKNKAQKIYQGKFSGQCKTHESKLWKTAEGKQVRGSQSCGFLHISKKLMDSQET